MSDLQEMLPGLEVAPRTLFRGWGVLAPWSPGQTPDGKLSTPYGSNESKNKALCGQYALASLMGCSLDYVNRTTWCEDISRGTSLMGMINAISGHCGGWQAFSTEKPTGKDGWKITWATSLPWPICGVVSVTFHDGDRHWVSTINGEVYDNLQRATMPIAKWERVSIPKSMDDMIVIGPAILRRDWRWRVSAKETHLNGGY